MVLSKWIILDRLREIQVLDSPQPNLVGAYAN